MPNSTNSEKDILLGIVIAVTLVGLGAQISGFSVADSILTGCIIALAVLAFYAAFRMNSHRSADSSQEKSHFSNGELEEYVNGIPAPAFVLGGNRKILASNGPARTVFGLPIDALVGLELDFVENRKIGQLPKADDKKFARSEGILSKDQIILLNGEDKITGSIMLVPIDNVSTEAKLILAVITPEPVEIPASFEPLSADVRENVLLHDDDRVLLRELNYDLRTRFQNASGIIDILDVRGSNAEGKPYITSLQKVCHEAVDRLDSLVSFLDLDEVDPAKKMKSFGLDELLNDVSFSLGRRLDIEENEILFDTDHSVAKSVQCNRELMTKIVSHLVLHVLAGQVGKTVLIRVRLIENDVSQPELSIEVMSNGMVEVETNGGINLDLEIARRIASQTGGQLFLGHRHLDFSGVLFRAPVTEVHTFNSGLVVPSHLKNLRALIVDDNEASRAVFEQLTSVLGWDVDVAASGESALHMIKLKQGFGETYDVILIDWRMPGLDGWETSKQVRELQHSGKIPIIVMISSHNRSFLSKNIEDRGRVLNGFLTKPVTLSMLLDAVADATAHIQVPADRVGIPHDGVETLTGNTVLVVDDNQMHREVAKEFMVRNGAKVLTASGGYEAISKVQNNRDNIDVVLMDVQMPDLNGFDAVRRIRELGYGDIPILMMTANSTSELHHHSLQAGANDVIIKPFVMREIVGALSEHVSRAKQRKRSRGERSVSVEFAEAADVLGFDTDVIDQHFKGRVSTYIKSLETFVDDSSRLLQQLEKQPDQENWKDIVREAHAVGGMLSVIGAAADAHRFKHYEGNLQAILDGSADNSVDAAKAIKDLDLQLSELISARLAASEKLLLRLEKLNTETSQ
ncbi:response regulator [Thalassospira lucentensis]|uniref:response regulator n=1 Tax=Thalassospira lucentensis TaxID=168935 RepID=UPI003D2F3E18